MNRIIEIAVTLVGVILAVLGFSGVLPQFGALGIFLIVLGLLFLGLSFIPRPDSGEVKAMPVFERLTKIFYAPAVVFKNLGSHPRWLVAILIMGTLAGAYEFAFVERVTPERIANFSAEKMTKAGTASAEKIDQNKQLSIAIHTNPYSKFGSLIGGFIGRILISCILGAVLMVLALAFGAKLNFWQGLSVAVYSLLPVVVIQKVLSLALLYIKNPADIHPIFGTSGLLPDNLGFLVSSAESPLMFGVLSYLSILGFYWLWLMATGLRNAGENVSPTIGWTMAGIIWVLGMAPSVLAAVFS